MNNVIFFLSFLVLLLFFNFTVTFVVCRILIGLTASNSIVRLIEVASVSVMSFVLGYLMFAVSA